MAYMITQNEADARDATQEALFKAWRAFGRFDPDRTIRPWLLQIVVNEARNRRRGAGRRERLFLRVSDEGEGASAAADQPLLDGADREPLLDALKRLPEHAREVLVCRYILDLSEGETAAALGIAEGTVKSRVSRALERLREVYGPRA
jgi:RNA polymerase sigma-70 factor (ECF subfamily)